MCIKPYTQWDKLPTLSGELAGFQPSTGVVETYEGFLFVFFVSQLICQKITSATQKPRRIGRSTRSRGGSRNRRRDELLAKQKCPRNSKTMCAPKPKKQLLATCSTYAPYPEMRVESGLINHHWLLKTRFTPR